MNFFYFRF